MNANPANYTQRNGIHIALIAITTIATVLISLYYLFSGSFSVFQNFFYIPIILSCIYYALRGFIYSVCLAVLYLLLIIGFTSEHGIIMQALVRVALFITIAGIITFLTIQRKKAEEVLRESEERFRQFTEVFPETMFEANLKGYVTYANKRGLKYFGYTQDDILKGLNIFNLVSPDCRDNVKMRINDQLQGIDHGYMEYKALKKDGSTFHAVGYSAPIMVNEMPVGVRGLILDVTERRQLEQKLEKMATHDFLTGLPNRALLLDRFNIAAALAQRNKTRIALMSLDLDKFKSINDTLGHDVGDQVLKIISARITETIRASDTMARVGGDEFILLMTETGTMKDTAATAQKILDAFKEPLIIDGHPLHLSTSIGIAIYPEDAKDIEALTKKSDAAMYYSKGHGRNQVKFFGDGDVRIGVEHKSGY